MGSAGMIAGAFGREAAEDQLVQLVLGDRQLARIADRYKVGPSELKATYRRLVAVGAGQWERGHWVAASTFAFGATLDYVLRELSDSATYEKSIEVASRLLDYFERGGVGAP